MFTPLGVRPGALPRLLPEEPATAPIGGAERERASSLVARIETSLMDELGSCLVHGGIWGHGERPQSKIRGGHIITSMPPRSRDSPAVENSRTLCQDRPRTWSFLAVFHIKYHRPLSSCEPAYLSRHLRIQPYRASPDLA